MAGSNGHGKEFSSLMKVILFKCSSERTLLHKPGTVQIISVFSERVSFRGNSRNNSSGSSYNASNNAFFVVAGYVILSMFSLLTCAGLIAILTLQPKPGEPLADVAGGAVCGISALSLILAAFGVLSSRCCKYPPPDNRVEHCAEGFTL